jgi:hypothetical protein
VYQALEGSTGKGRQSWKKQLPTRPAEIQMLRCSLSAYCFFQRGHGYGYNCTENSRFFVSNDQVDGDTFAGD